MDQKFLKEILDYIYDTAAQQKNSFTQENHVLCICCDDPAVQYRTIVERYNVLYPNEPEGLMNRDHVVRILKKCNLDRTSEREKLFAAANRVAGNLERSLRDESVPIPDVHISSHRNAKRIVLLALARRCPELREAYETILRLNRDFAAECLDGIIDLMDSRSQNVSHKDAGQLEMERIKASLARSNKLLSELQSSFDEQLADSCAEEQVRLFSMLNSEKYGHILDLLTAAQNGFHQMRKQKHTVPFEIRSVQTLVRRLLEFVEDCGVSPILEAGTDMTIRACDLDGIQYEGNPFRNPEEIKNVKVSSPGWQIAERDIVISYPRVRETGKDGF